MEEPSPEVITCAVCGMRFERQPRGRRPKCCTHCTTNRRRLEYEAQGHWCGDCGVAVERRVVNGPFPKFCGPCRKDRRRAQSAACLRRPKPRVDRSRLPPALCVDCGSAVPRPAYGVPAKRCPSCTVVRRRSAQLKAGGKCSDCGENFVWWADHWTKRCESCHGTWRLDLQRSLNVNRRMRLANVPYEFISRAQVFAEDGWTCGLCNLPVDRTLRWPDRGSATLDHIVPISLGGGHIRSNVQLAHALCNSRKGARPIELTKGS